MYSPDGELMCCCSEQKIQWYLSRGLAETLTNDPKSIRLLFQPKGLGHAGDQYYLSKKENHCVVCGSIETLTKHHCIPHMYRKNFPEEYKNSSSHDIVLLCAVCHDAYEVHADRLKKQIAEEFGISCSNDIPEELKDMIFVRRLARTLVLHGDKIPQPRQAELQSKISSILNEPVTDDLIRKIALDLSPRFQRKDSGKAIVEKIEDIESFCRRWRYHFVKTMNPQFLSSYWHPDRPTHCRVYPVQCEDGTGKV
jgi:exonuclease 3'-5' domain-containing protein 2